MKPSLVPSQDETMAPPAPLSCEVEGCRYTTRQGLNSFDQHFNQLRLHLAMAHPDINSALDNSAVSVTSSNSSRAEKLPRPNIAEDINETDWNYFEESWSRYKRSTGLEGQNIIDQLWACASQNLAKACYESGATSTTTEEELLKIMKKLSIKAQNKLVNVVQFLSMSQDTAEPVSKFVSRLKGQSKVCDFTVDCPKAGCDTAVSYSDKMVSHQLVRGLEDLGIQEKVLSLAATEKNLTLDRITEYVEAQETGSRSSKLLGAGAGVGNMSEYKRGRSNTLPSNLRPQDNTGGSEDKCNFCGKSGHGARPDIRMRKKGARPGELNVTPVGRSDISKQSVKTKVLQGKSEPAEVSVIVMITLAWPSLSSPVQLGGGTGGLA